MGEPPLDGAPMLRSLSCPRCAGPLAAQDGDRMVACTRCGGSFLLSRAAGITRRYIPATVGRLQAVGMAKRWLQQSRETPRDIGEASMITAAHLLYLPIWEAKAYVVGWSFGRKYRARPQPVGTGDDEGVTIQMVEEGVQEGLLTERRFYQAATDLSALGIGRPPISGREPTSPLLWGELDTDAVMLAANHDFELVQARAREAFLIPPTGTVGSVKLFLLRESISLLYCPLWSLQYRYRDRMYQITVDGRDGTVHSARAPADDRRRIAVLLASCVALAMALGVVVWVWSRWENARQVAVGVAFLILVLTSMVYWRFRLLREVEYHEPFSY
ncbi:MAG: hypothetical protein GX536_06705 [Actinobacteria bacterium]|nr:hypothetical protein [Actinomycetota bacterium]